MKSIGPALDTRRTLCVLSALLAGLGWFQATADTLRVEENDPAVVYAGTWYSQYRSDLSGGSIVESPDLNGTATLAFSGTGVAWIGFRAPWGGIAQVYLDGGLKATVDTYAPAEQAQALMYSVGGLPSGPHVIKIKVTGTWSSSGCCVWVVVDAFDVTDGGATGGSKHGHKTPHDTTAPTVGITSPSDGTTVSGAVDLNAAASDDGGVVGVQFLVDGSPLGPEDSAAPWSAAWDTRQTTDGQHTLTAVAHDAAGNRATSAPVTVGVNNRAPGPARFEERSATLAPFSAWTATNSAGVGVTLSGDSAVYASATGATATFPFSGTGVSWIGFPCERCGIARVRLDGNVAAMVDTYAPGRPSASQVMFSAGGLGAGSHTLVIEVTGTMNPVSLAPYIVVDAFDVM